ncbi:MAG TPA: hypothetical protein VFW42_08145 [Fluviicoccus sp.]|nr:hypothetical protein [Fluviicoccus sp.]
MDVFYLVFTQVTVLLITGITFMWQGGKDDFFARGLTGLLDPWISGPLFLYSSVVAILLLSKKTRNIRFFAFTGGIYVCSGVALSLYVANSGFLSFILTGSAFLQFSRNFGTDQKL